MEKCRGREGRSKAGSKEVQFQGSSDILISNAPRRTIVAKSGGFLAGIDFADHL